MMNVGTLKTLSYLTSFGLLGGIGYTAYDYYENGQHAVYFDKERATKVLFGVEAPKPPVPNGLNYREDVSPAVIGFDWTGAPPKVEVEIDPDDAGEPEEVVATPVDELLDVVTIICATDNPAKSSALIRLVSSGVAGQVDDIWMYTGDALPEPNGNISILDITPEHVQFSFSDEERDPENIQPHARAGTSLIAKAGPDGVIMPKKRPIVGGAASAASATARVNTERVNGQFYVGTEDAATFANDYESILSRDVSSETHMVDGKRAGIKITRVEAGSIAAQHGMQTGDVIKSINGTAVSSKQEAISFAKRNKDNYDIWRVEVENLGRTRIEVYHSPK